MKLCACCGKEIRYGDEAIEVRYGTFACSAHPHDKVKVTRKDFFHAACDVAIRQEASQ